MGRLVIYVPDALEERVRESIMVERGLLSEICTRALVQALEPPSIGEHSVEYHLDKAAEHVAAARDLAAGT